MVSVIFKSPLHVRDSVAGMLDNVISATLAKHFITMVAPVASSENVCRFSTRATFLSSSISFKFGCVTHHEDTFAAIPGAIAFAEDKKIPNSLISAVEQKMCVVSRNFTSPEPSLIDLTPSKDLVLVVVE